MSKPIFKDLNTKLDELQNQADALKPMEFSFNSLYENGVNSYSLLLEGYQIVKTTGDISEYDKGLQIKFSGFSDIDIARMSLQPVFYFTRNKYGSAITPYSTGETWYTYYQIWNSYDMMPYIIVKKNQDFIFNILFNYGASDHVEYEDVNTYVDLYLVYR